MDEKGFIGYMESKNLSITTQKAYLFKLQQFFQWAETEDIQVTKLDILHYLEYLKNCRELQNVSRQNSLFALNHYFTYLCQSEQIAQNPCNFIKLRGTKVKKLCNLYTVEQLDELYDNFYNVYIRNFQTSKYFGKATEEYIQLTRKRNLVVLGIMVYQGLLANEVKNIRLEDINLHKGTVRIASSKRGKERVLPLKVAQIGALMDYLQYVKPQLEILYKTTDYEVFLFSVENQNFKDVLHYIKKQIRKIDGNFKDFYQVRTSVITNWLKINDLRKAQYLAGHRSIKCTENYLPNNLESLIDDINNLHPFNL